MAGRVDSFHPKREEERQVALDIHSVVTILRDHGVWVALSDEHWQRLTPVVAASRRRGPRGRDDRRFVEAVAWVLRTGSPWRDLPGELGRWATVYQRFAAGHGPVVGKPSDEEASGDVALLIDSTIAKAHPHAAGALKKGARSRRWVVRAAGSRRRSTRWSLSAASSSYAAQLALGALLVSLSGWMP